MCSRFEGAPDRMILGATAKVVVAPVHHESKGGDHCVWRIGAHGKWRKCTTQGRQSSACAVKRRNINRREAFTDRIQKGLSRIQILIASFM
jgi:hypothetical protein